MEDVKNDEINTAVITPETVQEMRDDVEMAKAMSDITASGVALQLANNFIYYQDLLASEIARLEYKANQMRGKLSTVKEYMRTAKEHYKNLKEMNR